MNVAAHINRKSIHILAYAACLVLLAGCAGHPVKPDGIKDPLEKMNRAIYKFNDSTDRHIMKPVARAYTKSVPAPMRRGISNFYNNLFQPTTIVNDFLQGKFKQGFADFWRFAINTTVGLLGFMDPASKLGLDHHEEDFGQTFAVWGAGPGPYLVLPILGPSNLRDGVGLVPYYKYTYVPGYIEDDIARWSVITLNSINFRANLLGASEILEQAALDPYVFVREAYNQRRINQIYDGNPPLDYVIEP